MIVSEETFFEGLNRIDEIMYNLPSKDGAEKLSYFLSNQVLARYIFTNIKDINWLDFLRDEKAFKYSDENIKRESYWPQLDYLVRASKSKPDTVFEILKPFFSSQDTQFQFAILQAANNFNANQLIELSSAIKNWLKNDRSSFAFHTEFEHFIERMIKLELGDNVKQIFVDILSFRTKENSIDVDGKEHVFQNVLPLIEVYHYKEILEKSFKIFFDSYPSKAVEVLFNLLEMMISLKIKDPSANDYTGIWCSDLSEPTIEASHDVEGIVSAAFRDYAINYIGENSNHLAHVLSLLDKKDWIIFKRLKFFILSKKHLLLPDISRSLLSKVELIRDYEIHREYLIFLKAASTLLDKKSLKRLLFEIEKGPKDSLVDSESLNEEEKYFIEMRATYWKRERLVAIFNKLDANSKKILSNLEVEIKQHEEKHPPAPTDVWYGPQSSKTVEDLKALNSKQLIETLNKEPKKSKTFWTSSREGLARNFEALVKDDPNIIKDLLEDFTKDEPIYLSSLYSGVKQGLARFDENNWENLLKFTFHLLSSNINKKADVETDSWKYVRLNVAWLLNAALQQKSKVLHTDLADETWEIIECLCSDMDPVEDENSNDSQLRAYDRAINSVRGEALHCVIQFALRRHSDNKNSKVPVMEDRVRSILDQHIDLNYEKSLPVRSVYGRFLPWLILMDKTWVSSVLHKLFPNDKNKAAFLYSVWNTYLLSCPVYDNVFETIEFQYRNAVSRLNVSEDVSGNEKPNDKLAEHLMVLYWRSKLSLESDLLKEFYLNANIQYKQSAISFIGRSIKNTGDKIPQEITKRLVDLFNSRLAEAKPSGKYKELASFGWWFTSNQFDPKWRLEILNTLLQNNVDIEPNFDFIETFNELKDVDATLVLSCLELSILRDKSLLRVVYKKEIKELLNYFLKSQDDEVVKTAKKLINRLGSKGFLEFRELVQVCSY